MPEKSQFFARSISMVKMIFPRSFSIAIFAALLFGLLLSGCGTDKSVNVPVTEAWRQPLLVPVVYVVQPGDSLYSIAWMYGLDYRQVAKDNNINSPYHIRVGQKLRLTPQANANDTTPNASAGPLVITSKKQDTSKGGNSAAGDSNNQKAGEKASNNASSNSNNAVPAATAASVNSAAPSVTNKIANITWAWPAQGKVIKNFDPSNFNRGIDIAGKTGDPVLAAASGRVVYSGNGLRGYGQLIIIKHNDDYLSAYAHNQNLLVKEGQTVRLGQQIATVGSSEAKSPGLHFEVRLNGKPVDPLKYLPAR